MPKSCSRFLLLVVPVLLLASRSAQADQRTFVSAGTGSDANPCSRALPCRNFTAALTHTDPGGEVVALDSGGYGPVAVMQSAALVAPRGIHAAITAFAGDAVTVNAGPTDEVILRGLQLSGLGGSRGIHLTNGKTLHVENCSMTGFSEAGFLSVVGGADIFIRDTASRQNFHGFRIGSVDGPITRASLTSVRAEGNTYDGVLAIDHSAVTVTRSLAAGNGGTGFYASVESAVMNIESCTSAMNVWGVFARGVERVSDTMITANMYGVSYAEPGSAISFGNNSVVANGLNGTFTTTVGQQ